jgi:hypothetical protein
LTFNINKIILLIFNISGDKDLLLINLNKILTAIALAIGVAAVVLVILKNTALETSVMMLGIGLFALALATSGRKSRQFS